jgi:hypothetical protein
MLLLATILLYDVVYTLHNSETDIVAANGVFDARHWDIDATPVVSLNGAWVYTPGGREDTSTSHAVTRNVPSPFQPDAYARDPEGVYSLKILLPPDASRNRYTLNVESVFSAHSLVVNGEDLVFRGTEAPSRADWYALNRPYIVDVRPQQNSITIEIHIVNQQHNATQGIIRHIQFGNQDIVTRQFRNKDHIEFAFAFLFALISVILFVVRGSVPVYRGTIYLACFLLALAVFILTAPPTHKLIYDIIPFTGNIAYSIQMRCYYTSIIAYVFFLFFVDQLFPKMFSKRALHFMGITGVVFVVAIMVLPIQTLTTIEALFLLYRFGVLIGFTVMSVRILRLDATNVSYDVVLLYFSLFIFTTKSFFYYIRFNDATQTPYVEVAVAVGVMVYIVLQTYRRVHQEQLKLALAFHNARIKPHFLFNALNSIHDAIYEEPAVAQRLLLAFSQFLRNRFRFSDFSALVPLHEEVDILEAYLLIEQDRFRERIHIHRDIAPESLSSLVPQLFLQPLVENAIHHGILKQRHGGSVTISVVKHMHELVVTISDTGVGIAPQRLINIFRGGIQDSIGVMNIHTRLLYLYGKGLDIQSTEGIGTVVRCQIPVKAQTAP